MGCFGCNDDNSAPHIYAGRILNQVVDGQAFVQEFQIEGGPLMKHIVCFDSTSATFGGDLKYRNTAIGANSFSSHTCNIEVVRVDKTQETLLDQHKCFNKSFVFFVNTEYI